jgi:formamidopyrimidine-DNA glycosylase
VPELPEVEVVRAGLEPAVTGATVASVTVYDERSLRRHSGPSEDFVDRLTGRRMLAPQRRGKFLWIPLLSEIQELAPSAPVPSGVSGRPDAPTPEFPKEALVVHLGMSGQVLLRDRDTDDALTRVRLELETPLAGPSGRATHRPLRLNFVDQRIFGSMAIDELVPALDRPSQLVPSSVSHIARDPIDELFDERRFFSLLARKNTTIKRALLDQTLVSGIGNIYADESLWGARVHYEQPTPTLSRAKGKLLLFEVRAVLAQALAEGGTSFDSQYLNVNGVSGYFAHSLKVYGQQGKPCPRCGRPVVREQFMNRGSHFCAFCQRVR